jgi:hypothetical protein
MNNNSAVDYAYKMKNAIDLLNEASRTAYMNGRDDANPFDDLMMLFEFISAAPNESTALEAFIHVVKNGVEMPSINPLDENDSTLYEACHEMLVELRLVDTDESY